MNDELDELRSDEGWRAFPYSDHMGYQTIGYGFLIDARRGGGLPKPVGEFWLRYAFNERLGVFRKLWPAYDDQPGEVKRALSMMAYQMGAAGLFAFKRMLAALAGGYRSVAADEALDSEWGRDPETADRAKRMAALIRGRA